MDAYMFNGECPTSVKQAFIDAYKVYHADTWYKYAGDTKWKKVSITGAINSSSIPDVKSVVTLEIGSDVTSIETSAFSNCIKLISVTIPDSVMNISDEAFTYCSNLTSVYITDIAKWCKISFGDYYGTNPLSYAHNLYLNGEKVTNLVIPNSVTSIESFAFHSCSSLVSMMIPDSVTSIGRNAFTYCSGLTSVTIGNGVTSIGSSAFYGCSGLTSVMIPNSMTSIGNYAFTSCTGLTSVTIPDSITSIGKQAFYNCNKLTSVTITGEDMTKAENVKQMMISAGVSSSIEWHMGS